MKKYLPLIFLLFAVCIPRFIKAQFNPNDTAFAIYFETGKYNLDSVSKVALEKVYKRFIVEDKQWPYGLFIYGYADQVGSDKSNLILSKKRANAVYEYFLYLAHDTALWKEVAVDYYDYCGGEHVRYERYPLDPQYIGYGEKHSLLSDAYGGKQIDSMITSGLSDRKVVVRFHSFIPRDIVFYACLLPARDSLYVTADSVVVFLPKGYFDTYVTKMIDQCLYDTVPYEFVITDSFPNKGSFCTLLEKELSASKVPKEIPFGVLNFQMYLKGKPFTDPKCEGSASSPLLVRIPLDILPVGYGFKVYGISDKGKIEISSKVQDSLLSFYVDLRTTRRIEIALVTKDYLKNKYPVVKVKGKKANGVSVNVPGQNCVVEGIKEKEFNFLFFHSSKYRIIQFKKEKTEIEVVSEKSGTKKKRDLNTLHYRKRKNTYVYKNRK